MWDHKKPWKTEDLPPQGCLENKTLGKMIIDIWKKWYPHEHMLQTIMIIPIKEKCMLDLGLSYRTIIYFLQKQLMFDFTHYIEFWIVCEYLNWWICYTNFQQPYHHNFDLGGPFLTFPKNNPASLYTCATLGELSCNFLSGAALI